MSDKCLSYTHQHKDEDEVKLLRILRQANSNHFCICIKRKHSCHPAFHSFNYYTYKLGYILTVIFFVPSALGMIEKVQNTLTFDLDLLWDAFFIAPIWPQIAVHFSEILIQASQEYYNTLLNWNLKFRTYCLWWKQTIWTPFGFGQSVWSCLLFVVYYKNSSTDITLFADFQTQREIFLKLLLL